ncbi:MAG: hypothetical protein PHW67_04795 [Bacilli bacterium]|nr:hypothetical protein [Bacilli bacterium]
MKKTLVTLSLLSAMATSMVAGTMALYQKTISASDVAVTAKTFVFNAAASGTWDTSVKLAPGESTSEYTFLVQNFTTGSTDYSEVDIAVTATVAFTVDSTTATAYQTGSTIPAGQTGEGTYETLTESNFTTSYTMADSLQDTFVTLADFTLTKDVASKKYIKVKVTWNQGDYADGDGDGISNDAEIQGMKLGDITLKVVGSQA